jgi:hypothetical protein
MGWASEALAELKAKRAEAGPGSDGSPSNGSGWASAALADLKAARVRTSPMRVNSESESGLTLTQTSHAFVPPKPPTSEPSPEDMPSPEEIERLLGPEEETQPLVDSKMEEIQKVEREIKATPEPPDLNRMIKRAGAAAVNYTVQGLANLNPSGSVGPMSGQGMRDPRTATPQEPLVPTGPAENFWDKVADTAGSLVPQVAELMGMNLIMPGAGAVKALGKGGKLAKVAGGVLDVGRSAGTFAAQSTLHANPETMGEEAAHGAAMGGVFRLIEFIPAAGIPAKVGKTVLESVAMERAAAMQGGDEEDRAIAFLLPWGIKGSGKAVKAMAGVLRGDAAPLATNRKSFDDMGIERTGVEQRMGMAKAAEAVKQMAAKEAEQVVDQPIRPPQEPPLTPESFTDPAKARAAMEAEAAPEPTQKVGLKPEAASETPRETAGEGRGTAAQGETAPGIPVSAETAKVGIKTPDVTAALEPSWMAKQGTRARSEFMDALKGLTEHASLKAVGDGKGGTNPLDPEFLKLAGNVVAKGVKAGAYSFGEFVEYMGRTLGHEVVVKLGPALEQAWNDARKTMPTLSEVKPVAEFFKSQADPKAEFGRPDLSKYGAEGAKAEVISAADEQLKQAGAWDVRHDTEVKAKAEQELAANRAGEVAKLKDFKGDKPMTDVEVRKALTVRDEEFARGVQTGDVSALETAVDAHNAQRLGKREAARTLRQGAEEKIKQMQEGDWQSVINDELLRMPEGVQKKYDRATAAGQTETAEAIKTKWATQVGKLSQKLKQRGYELDNPEFMAALEPYKREWLRNRIAEWHADGVDKWSEFYRSSLMSSTGTWSANGISNFASGVMDMGTTALETVLSGGGRVKGAAAPGEMLPALRATMGSFGKAWSYMLKSMYAEAPMYDIEMGNAGAMTAFDRPTTAIKGVKGRVVRALGYDMSLALDQFGKVLIGEAKAAAHAHRLAKGDAAKVKAMLDDPMSDARIAAMKDASELLFQSRPGKIGQTVIGLRNRPHSIPTRVVATLLAPFVTTTANVAKIGLRKGPLGTYKLLFRDIPQAMESGDWSKIPKRAAETVLAAAVTYGLYELVADDDKGRPRITGSQPVPGQSPFNPDKLIPPYSFRIGDTYYDYGRVEPIGSIIGMAVDTAYALKNGDYAGMAVPLNSLVEQVANKTFLRSVGDLVRIAQSQDKEKAVSEFATNIVVGHVPNIIRSTSRRLQGEVQDRGMPSKGDPEYWGKLGTRMAQKTELGIVDSYPKHGVFGDPIRPRSKEWPVTDFMYRMFVPAERQAVKSDVAQRAIINWNLQNPDKAYNPDAPDRYYTRGGTKVYMSDQEYAEFTKRAGEYAKNSVGWVDAVNPSEDDLKQIQKAIEEGRAQARSELFGVSRGSKSSRKDRYGWK